MTITAVAHLNAPAAVWQPTWFTPPGDIAWDYSQGDLAIAIANYALSTSDHPEMRLDPWQEWLLREMLQQYPASHPLAGRFRFRQYVVSLGRQNGKTTLASALVLYLMLCHHAEPNVVSLASNLEQANIAYLRVLNLVNSHPSLRKRFRRATETRGMLTADEKGRYRCLAAKAASLQGHTVSGVVADELHIMQEAVYHAITIGAGQIENSLVIGITTAGDSDSVLLKWLYEQGKAETPGLGFALWEAPEGAAVDDVDALKAANPAFACGRMSEQQILNEVRLLPEPDAIRYRLNRFIEQENSWLPYGAWEALPRWDEGRADVPVHLIVDRTPDWGAATITANWQRPDGTIVTDVVASVVKPDLDRLVELCTVISRQVPHRAFYMDGLMLETLEVHLKQRGIVTRKFTLRDHLNACSTAYQAIAEGRVAHPHHDIVGKQIPRAVRKNVGEQHRLTRTNVAVELDACMATVLGIYIAATEPDAPLQVF